MEKKQEKEIILNIPTRLRYYLDPLAIIVGTILVCIAIWYAGTLLK